MDHCTASLQFNKIGFDQKRNYVVGRMRQSVESGLVREMNNTVVGESKNLWLIFRLFSQLNYQILEKKFQFNKCIKFQNSIDGCMGYDPKAAGWKMQPKQLTLNIWYIRVSHKKNNFMDFMSELLKSNI